MNPMADMVHQFARVTPTFSAVKALPSVNFTKLYSPEREYICIDGHEIEIRSEQILHHDPKWFQNVYIVPTVKGSYRVKCSIMCSEYLEPEEKIIDIEVV
jgi:hypothetical protein